jgi:hypothetical protein
MGLLAKANPNARELVTEDFNEVRWWSTLQLVVEFLGAKAVEAVHIEFGFVLGRDIAGKQQPPNQVIQLADLEKVIRRGFDEGTIEWKRSDFFFYPLGTELAFMLCNDADLHFASTDSSLLLELAHTLRSNGIRVYDSGKLIET